MYVVAIAGSLRRDSYNLMALRALKAIAPQQINIEIIQIGNLPLFNPDLEKTIIDSVLELKESICRAQGLVIASPEYAHGISGPMKNALDWLVSGEEFPGKPIMLVNTSPRASHAQDALKEVLVTMSGNIIESACVKIPLLGSGLDAESIIEDRRIVSSLSTAIDNFVTHIRYF